MTTARPETERILADLQQELTQKLASWNLPNGIELDEIIAESIEAFWIARELRNKTIGAPIRWLLSTARRIKLEKFRSVKACRGHTLSNHVMDTRNKSRSETIGIADSSALSALGPAKQFAITEILMFDRGVTEVARELGVKRSTVNGWICRLPKRLAQSLSLQAFSMRDES